MKSLLVYLKDYKKESILAPLFKMLEALFELFVPLVMANVIDIGIANQDRGYIVKMCFVLVALGLIGLVCSITAQYFSAKAAAGFGTGVRHALFAHVQKLTFSDMDTLGTSTLITRMTSDINQAQSGVNLTLRLFLRSPFIVFGAMVMAFTVDVKAALVFVVTIPVLSVIVFGIMLVTMPLYKKVQSNLDRVLLTTRENLAGARVIRAFNKEEDETVKYEKENQVLTDAQNFVGRISGLMNPLTYIVVNGAIVVLIYIGAIRVDIGDLTQGEVVALINYMSQILVELVKLANLIVSMTKAVACGNRIESVLKVTPDMLSGSIHWDDLNACDGQTAGAPEDGVAQNAVIDAAENGKSHNAVIDVAENAVHQNAVPLVEFDHVSIAYKGSNGESLSDVSFKAYPGQTIGIIGGTGSGKSTLVNMIPRFYDATAGEIRIKGEPIKSFDIDSLRNHIGMVLQKAVLFKGSIEENLRWGKEDATTGDIEEALEVSQAKEFVDAKEGRLKFQIEQGGKNLSGGQKQRLTIARALVRKPEILILDDSASALDFATDAALRKAIRGMSSAPTVFIVSQRASSIQYADQIIVLDDGEVMGVGKHADLLENCETYQEIYYSQFPKEAAANE